MSCDFAWRITIFRPLKFKLIHFYSNLFCQIAEPLLARPKFESRGGKESHDILVIYLFIYYYYYYISNLSCLNN